VYSIAKEEVENVQYSSAKEAVESAQYSAIWEEQAPNIPSMRFKVCRELGNRSGNSSLEAVEAAAP
jgi:hypothetical protein